ncbi:MAG: TetR/AcrR family transcriptional regulator [Myxococcota bacterium]
MSDPELPRTERGRRTRRALLDAAEIEFGGRGFAEASIVDITRRAAVAQGTFYTYFPSKEAVFAELVRELSHLLRAAIAAAVAGLDRRVDIERAGLVAFFRFVQEHRALYRIVRQAEYVDEELFRWYYRRLADGYVRGLAAAADRGELGEVDVETTAWALMGMADFLGLRFVLWADEPPPERVIDTVTELLRGGLFAPR